MVYKRITIGANDGSPSLGVMGGNSCSEGCGFELLPHILDEHFSHLFFVIIVMMVV